MLLVKKKISVGGKLKKVLFIDPLSQEGHISYNNYWLNSMDKLQIDYDFVFRENYIKLLKKNNGNLIYEIPNKMYHKIEGVKNFFLKRYYLIKILNIIKSEIELENYDVIIFSSFENFSFLFNNFPSEKIIYAVLHGNLEKIDNKIIFSILKLISKKIIFISLDNYIKDILNKIHLDSIVIPHPIPDPFKNKKNKNLRKLTIFSPSKTSIDEKIINSILIDEKFHLFLKENNIKFILRSSLIDYRTDYLEITKKYLTENEYQNFFQESSIIFLPYKKEFKNRISNIFFEAISNNKVIISSKCDGLLHYKGKTLDDIFYYDDIKSLKSIILKIIKNNKIHTKYEDIKKEYSQEEMKSAIKKILVSDKNG